MADIALDRFHALGAPTLTPDGAVAVAAVSRPDPGADTYRSELWTVPTDGSAPPRRLTRGGRDSAPRFAPDGSALAFLRAAEPAPGRSAAPQLHVLPAGGGEPWAVTDAPLGVAEFAWSPDSARIAYTARVPEEGRYQGAPGAEPPRRITGYAYRVDGVGFTQDKPAQVFTVAAAETTEVPESEQVTEGPYHHAGIDWSPGGGLLAFAAARHETHDSDIANDVWVCAPDGTGLRRLTGTTLTTADPRFSADGAEVYFAAHETGPGRDRGAVMSSGLWSVPAAGGTPERLTDEERVHVAMGTEPTPVDGGVLLPVENRGAVDLLFIPQGGGEAQVLLSGPRLAGTAARAGGVTAAAVGDQESPGELVALDDSGERVLTAIGTGNAWRPLEEIDTAADDGHPVHGWLVRPDGPGPHPVLLLIHGGPFAQYSWRVFDEAQVYADHGYAVVMGNPRGSSGYGQAHGQAVVGDVGEICGRDLIALLDAALKGDGLDGDRVGVLGGSHGGFMTAWLAGHHPDRFRAAVPERGVYAIDSFLGSSDIGWFFSRDLWDEPETWAANSPIAAVPRTTAPTLVIHSEEDWRVPLEQAQRYYVALRQSGVTAELLLFPGEGHEMSRSGLPSHRLARFDAILDWFGRHL